MECRRIAIVLAALCIIILSSCGGGGGDSVPNNTPLSSDKAITAFSFTAPARTGSIDESAKTISVTVPAGTNVTALVATYAATGTNVKVDGIDQVSGTTPNDFTNPVAYVVTAEDSSSATYTVTVSITAPAGSLDTSFGTGGTVTTAVGIYHDYAKAVAIQPDGRIVVAGTAYADATGVDFAVVRYNADGTLDTGFHSTGTVTTTFTAGGHDNAQAVALQNNGKIVVAGFVDSGSGYQEFALARYNTDGSLDTGFRSTGTTTTLIGSTCQASAVAVQSDGKIVAAGYTSTGGNQDFALARYTTDGALDTDFGTNGIVTTPVGTASEAAFGMVLQSDGKIVAVGYTIVTPPSKWNFAVIRYNADGSLDTGFGTNGMVSTPIGTSYDYARAVALQPDGKIVVAGYSSNDTDWDFALVRYNSDGSLDSSFGTDGKVVTAVGASTDDAYSVAIQTDGKIVAVGYTYNGDNDDMVIVRYNGDGSLDTSFGTGGKVIPVLGESNDYGSAVAVQTDGKIVAVGYTEDDYHTYFAVARYNP